MPPSSTRAIAPPRSCIAVAVYIELYVIQCAGDPFTRLLRPGQQSTAFQNTTEGQVKALGLSVAAAPNNRLQVGLVLNGSPAESAGVQAGDEILEINGRNIQSKSKE